MTKKQNVLAKLRFTLPEKDTRAFHSTQPGDLSETIITLGSTRGKLKKRDENKDEPFTFIESGTVALQRTSFADNGPDDENRKKQTVTIARPSSVSLCFALGAVDRSHDKKKPSADGFGFLGFWVASDLGSEEKVRNPDTKIRFNGTINMAAGAYQGFFGAQAALTYDTDSGEGLLRIMSG